MRWFRAPHTSQAADFASLPPDGSPMWRPARNDFGEAAFSDGKERQEGEPPYAGTAAIADGFHWTGSLSDG